MMDAKAVAGQLPSASWNGIRFESKERRESLLPAPWHHTPPTPPPARPAALSSPRNKSATLAALGVGWKGWGWRTVTGRKEGQRSFEAKGVVVGEFAMGWAWLQCACVKDPNHDHST